MFGSIVLDAIFGMLALFTLLGICVTTLTEVFQSMVQKVRAANLHQALQLLLTGTLKATAESDRQFLQSVLDHPLVTSMALPGKRPSYLDSHLLAQVIVDLLLRAQDTRAPGDALTVLDGALARGIASVPSAHLRGALQTLYDSVRLAATTEEALLLAFKDRLVRWIDAVMDRAAGWTRRNAKFVSLVCSLGLCLALNVNAFDLMKGLVRDDSVRSAGLETAAGLINNNFPEQVATLCKGNANPQQCQFASALDLLRTSPKVAIGWGQAPAFMVAQPGQAATFSWVWFAYWLAGVMTAALAASLGGDFWFRILGQVIRLTGTKTVQEPKP